MREKGSAPKRRILIHYDANFALIRDNQMPAYHS
jgi:hypothetical protein